MPYVNASKTPIPRSIYYETYGNAQGMPIVFHHGNGNSVAEWTPLGYLDKELLDHYYIVLIDMLGYGKSEKSLKPTDYDPQLRALDTIAVLDELGLKQDVIFFGGSMGGQLGFTLALHPEHNKRFRAFIINGATPYGTEELSPLLVGWLNTAKQVGMPAFMKQLEVTLQCKFPEGIRKLYEQNNVDAMIASNTIPWPDYGYLLSSIRQPFLLIVGERDDILPKVKSCAQQLQKCQLEIVFGQDHVNTYWRGDLIVPYIKAFARKFNMLR